MWTSAGCNRGSHSRSRARRRGSRRRTRGGLLPAGPRAKAARIFTGSCWTVTRLTRRTSSVLNCRSWPIVLRTRGSVMLDNPVSAFLGAMVTCNTRVRVIRGLVGRRSGGALCGGLGNRCLLCDIQQCDNLGLLYSHRVHCLQLCGTS